MGEYEERYPESYGNSEETTAAEPQPVIVNMPEAGAAPPPPRHVERAQRPLVERPAHEICDDVFEQLNASPFIDASGISISVDGSEVTLDGTIDTLFAVSVAKSLTSNVPGVSRVQVQLRVQPTPHGYEIGPDRA
jgi:hypothetical protein